MKKILSACIISLVLAGQVQASILVPGSSLVPSLEKQMQRQTLLNKKNTLADKKREAERKKQENIARLAAIRNANQNTTTIKIASSQGTSQVNAPVRLATQAPTIATQRVPDISRGASSVPGVDMARVRDVWLGWYNDARAKRGLGTYSYDSRLDSTAHEWNTVFAGSRGTNFHERKKGDGYYNYPIINRWFADRGVNPPLISGVNHSENVSYGYYTCNKSDCTDDLISAIRSSYNFFINSSVHSRSVYQPNFTKIGFDVIVVPSERRYYITVHYMTR